jgi:DNA-binding NtrC family response regulator
MFQCALSNPPRGVRVLLAAGPEVHAALAPMFRRRDWQLHRVSSCYAAIAFVQGVETGIVICEERLADGDWTVVLNGFKGLVRTPALIVTSQLADAILWAEVFSLGGYDVLAQPFDPEEVFRVVSSASFRWDDHWKLDRRVLAR